MRTMHPVLMVGFHGPDDEWLPDDEYSERIRDVRRIIDANRLDGLVIHGDCDDASMLTYLTNFFPRNRWGICTLGQTGDPVLYVAGGTRDLPFAAAQTRLPGVQPYGAIAQALPSWLHAIEVKEVGARPRLGCVGFGSMLPPVHATVAAAIEGAELVDADGIVQTLLARKRPREVATISRAVELLDLASSTVANNIAAGRSVSDSLLAAELAARKAAAHDVRILATVQDSRVLEPFSCARLGRALPLVAYIAVRNIGYWAAGFITISGDERSNVDDAVTRALDKMLDAARPGLRAEDLAALAEPQLEGLAPHPAHGGKWAHGIGLGLAEHPVLSTASDQSLHEGGVYSLQVGAVDASGHAAMRSGLVHLPATGGARLLWKQRG